MRLQPLLGNTAVIAAVGFITLLCTPSQLFAQTTSPSGEAMPVGNLPGWNQIFTEDFTKDAPTGSWGTNDAAKVVYTGDLGGKWVEYPDGWSSTYTGGKVGYMPSQVLSVHNGVLDFYLHRVNGIPAGANPSPLITGSSQYQTYGRYSARFKVMDSGLSDYYAAWLLWPQSDGDGACAESDFPEGRLDGTIGGFAHYNDHGYCGYNGNIQQDALNSGGARFTNWHTYTQEWMPKVRKYYLDGNLIGTSTNYVWDKPERWQLQTEPSGSNNGNIGHLLVDWVVAYCMPNTTGCTSSIVTAAPTPTVTPAAKSTQIHLTICPHGIGNCGDNVLSQGGNTIPLTKIRTVTIGLYDANDQPVTRKQGTITYSSDTGTFVGSIPMDTVASGNYIARIFMDGYLSKQVPGTQQITNGQSVTIPEISLIAGDINRDDQLDIQDYNLLISCFRSKQTSASCGNASASDLDDDGTVDGADYNLFLRELSVQKKQ